MIKTVNMYMKHNDLTSFTLENDQGKIVFDKDSDYFPHVGSIGGDETEFRIDNATGKILNWKPITDDEVKELKAEEGEDQEDENLPEEDDSWMGEYRPLK